MTGEDGEEVHVGWNGIHVEDPKEDSRIHIDGSGVFVDDKNMIKKNGVKFVKKKAGITTMKIIQSFLLHYLQLLLISG